MEIADRLHENTVTLEIIAPTALGTVFADEQRLKQILIKLLMNATNFAPEGSAISLNCWRDESNVFFSVTDRGPGIPPDMLKTVFDRFKANAKGGKRSGAGLGLSIVESFVTLHNGDVSIDSRAGQGTVVTCRIPVGSRARSVAAE